MSEQEANEAELRAALEEQMKHIRVEDVLLQTIVTLINLAARRLGLAGSQEEAGEKDPNQARLAIEGARALVALIPGPEVQPIRDALSQVQMAYVQETGGARSEEQAPQAPAPEQPSAEEAERAKARSKLWTPPGS